MYTLEEAIEALRPGADWIQYETEYSGLRWLDETQTKPTEEEIVQKVAELEYKKEVEAYKQQRAAEYPSMAEQQDMQFHDAINGTTTWKDAIQAVKDKYPKKKMNTRTLNKRKKDALAKLEASRES
jgi:hypothetical protein